MHSKSDTMINDKADEIFEKHFESLLNRYQIGLETSVRDSDFIFDCVHVLYYKCQKINFKQVASYIGSRGWIKNKTAAINLINPNLGGLFGGSIGGGR